MKKLTLSTACGLSLLAVTCCVMPSRVVADDTETAAPAETAPADPEAAPAEAAPVVAAAPAELVTPAQWFASQPKPHFKAGNTLPRLTRYGWGLNVETQKEIAEEWNYCLQTNYLSPETVERALKDPGSDEGRMVALTLSNTKKYPLCVILDRSEPADQVPDAFLHDAAGKLANNQSLYSPIAPQIAYDKMAELRAAPLRKLRAQVPITIVLNGGEYGLGVLGFMQKYLEADPKVQAARGQQDWFTLVSKAKAREFNTIAQAVREAAFDRQLYVYYNSGNTHRNRYGGWGDWGYDPAFPGGTWSFNYTP